eukprot:TRINITY_DN6199_c0_g1_i1.p1 TRINITY_DN6199_c0_g1~~TRINITY_DN6199_c0_g1_i1.p1  ORF type:complete len:167 (-),score=13.92 TRINITY_DN6199_c0_g1_i1:58-558(-)
MGLQPGAHLLCIAGTVVQQWQREQVGEVLRDSGLATRELVGDDGNGYVGQEFPQPADGVLLLVVSCRLLAAHDPEYAGHAAACCVAANVFQHLHRGAFLEAKCVGHGAQQAVVHPGGVLGVQLQLKRCVKPRRATRLLNEQRLAHQRLAEHVSRRTHYRACSNQPK